MRRKNTLEPPLRIGIWNVAWKSWNRPAGRMIVERMWAHSPDVVCITEGRTAVPPAVGGYWIAASDDYGYAQDGDRRKVLMWSRNPWTDVDDVGSPRMPGGRFVAGRTETSLGDLTVLGMCVPWRDAHVRTGRRDRTSWEDHAAYLEGLEEVLARRPDRRRLILAGDFNQQVPRQRSPLSMYELLSNVTQGLAWATRGRIPGLDKPVIDHLVHTNDLVAMSVLGIPAVMDDGRSVSDHPGILVDLGSDSTCSPSKRAARNAWSR
ncbi:MAG: endonuclease/exonuclease/phosphatase family protein [Gemmatimonadota bacterium]